MFEAAGRKERGEVMTSRRPGLRGDALPGGGRKDFGWSGPDRTPIWWAATMRRERRGGGIRCSGLRAAMVRGDRKLWLSNLWAWTGGFWAWVWAFALGPITHSVFCWCALFCFISCLGFSFVVCFYSGVCFYLGVSRVAGSSIRLHVWEAVVYRTLGLCKRVTHECYFPRMSLKANRVPIVGTLCYLVSCCLQVCMESPDIISGLCNQGYRFYVPPLYSTIFIMEA